MQQHRPTSPSDDAQPRATPRRPVHPCALTALLLAAALCCALPAHASDSLECQITAGTLRCNVDLRDFLDGEIRDTLNNGWENTLHFQLVLLDERGKVAAVTVTDLTQRCYIDPFDDPCLALWRSARTWDTYDDVDAMIAAIGVFELVSVAVADLPAGTYSARLDVELNPITDEQVSVIRSWLARHRGGHLVVGKNESSIFGTFVSVFANVRPGHAEAMISLETPPFAVE